MTIKYIKHTADIQFEVKSKKLENIFLESAQALKKSFFSGKIKNTQKKKIMISGKDIESLLYNFLEEFLILFDSENFIFSKIENLKINEKDFKLSAILLGDTSEKYKFDSHVKAITYNEMYVKKINEMWGALITIDV